LIVIYVRREDANEILVCIRVLVQWVKDITYPFAQTYNYAYPVVAALQCMKHIKFSEIKVGTGYNGTYLKL
jgi:hypothetical protein